MSETNTEQICGYCGGPLIVRGQGAVNCRDCNRPPTRSTEKTEENDGGPDK